MPQNQAEILSHIRAVRATIERKINGKLWVILQAAKIWLGNLAIFKSMAARIHPAQKGSALQGLTGRRRKIKASARFIMRAKSVSQTQIMDIALRGPVRKLCSHFAALLTNQAKQCETPQCFFGSMREFPLSRQSRFFHASRQQKFLF
ncbi:MAG: hypothetical protein ACPGNV_07770 [Mangrovicoccus sp.]